MKVTFFTLMALLLCSASLGCSGSGASPVDKSGLSPVAALPEDIQSSLEPMLPDHSFSEFTLEVLDESYIYGSSAQQERIAIDDNGTEVVVSVMVDGAEGLKALYYSLGYDASAYRPLEATPAPAFGDSNDMLTLAKLDETGMVYGGQVLIHPQDQTGFTGSGAMAIVRFAKEAAPIGRYVSSPPVFDLSAAQLSRVADAENYHLLWGFTSQGDYDQNSETNSADLTPIAVHFAKVGPFDYYSVESAADGDSNGEINAADITPIGLNFNRRVLSYNVYAAPTLDAFPLGNADVSTLDPLGTVAYDQAIGTRATERLRFNFDLTGQVADQYYWVRPADGAEEGTPSNDLLHETLTLLPVVVLTADPVSGNVPLSVAFDASASTSPLGPLANFAWDLDGDGAFSETDNGEDAFNGLNTANFVYDTPGTYSPAVQVTCPRGLTASQAVDIAVAVTPPVAAISGTPLTGKAPLFVEFDAAASTDADGTIVKYEWDYDGDGTFDEDTGAVSFSAFTFPAQGNYDTTVRVTDDDGATDTASMSESGGGVLQILAPNVAPVADILADTTSGTLPLTVNFDASGSTDSDGTIELYEWDFDGDGTYDLDTGASPNASVDYTVAGNFDPTVRVTDNDGASATESLSASGAGTITVIANVPPVASITADLTSGPLPLTVNFDATLSTDADGTVVNYEWDWEGDGTYDFDSGATPNAAHEYTIAGDYDPTVRVTDDYGDTDTASLSDTVTGGLTVLEPPVASLTATPLSGDAPLSVDFDASGSTDDGTIVLYEWDLDYNGIFETTTGATPTVTRVFGEKGAHLISVRVTDDDGLTGVASVDITLNTGFVLNAVVLDILMDSKASLETFGTDPDEFPALAYKDADTDDLYFIRALDGTAQTWDDPVAVLTTGQVGNDATLRNINGVPGISFKRAQSKLDFILAEDALGESWWTDSVEIDGGGGAGAFTSLAVVDGKPAVASIAGGFDDLRFATADAVDGSTWNAPFDIEASLSGGDEIEFTDLELVDGLAGVVFNFVGTDTGLKFIRATNAAGTTWGTSVIVDTPGGGGRYPALCTVDTNPAVSYQAFSVNELRFCRATSTDGSSWGTPVTVDSGTDVGEFSSMCVAGGVPVIAYHDGGNQDLKFAMATDAQGGAWTTFVIDGAGDVGHFTTMTVVDDIPVIAYYDATNTALKIAVFEF